MPRITILIVALFFGLGGIAHFAYLDSFIKIMPAYIPYHKQLVIISGAFEILGAIGILMPKTRVAAAYGLIALSVAVFPANVNMALHYESFSNIPQWVLYFRLPLQIVIIWFIWWAVKPELKFRKG